MKKVLYFAFGSNMYSERIGSRLANPVKVGTYKLMGWKLMFNAESDYGMHTYANIVQGKKTDFVEGVLYQITHDQFKRLDMYEGLYERQYFDIDADTLGCAYVCPAKYCGTYYTPQEYYIELCIKGAIENELDHTTAMLINLKDQIDFDNCYRPKGLKDY